MREDGGSYCCKGLMQALNSCDESATVTVNITILPMIIPGQDQTVVAGGNATVECIIGDEGSPPFVLQWWQKSGQRLVIDGTKYISSPPNRTIMFLTIVNFSAEDVGHYECILETVIFETKQASVYLFLNHTGRSHTGVSYIVIIYVSYIYICKCGNFVASCLVFWKANRLYKHLYKAILFVDSSTLKVIKS